MGIVLDLVPEIGIVLDIVPLPRPAKQVQIQTHLNPKQISYTKNTGKDEHVRALAHTHTHTHTHTQSHT